MIVGDMFAGLGGWTEAAELLGLTVAIAANHNALAVKAHAANHPRTRHVLQDLQQANFHEWPRLNVLLASPACQGHSEAATGGRKGKGKKRGENPKHDRDRSTAWAVIAAAEALRPEVMLVENVLEMLLWKLYGRWQGCLEDLGYHVQVLRLCASKHGVPQERDRVFIVATRKKLAPIVVPEQPRIPVSEVVDLRRGEWQRVRWAAEGVQERVARARSRGFPEGPFVTQNTTDHSGRDLARPLGTVTTCSGHWGLVRPGPKGDEYRLLMREELRDVCGFRRDYWLPRAVTHAAKLLGNAVPPPLGRAVLKAVLEAAA
jgi:DNA (cytosine-5)-methyltransferase 1